MTIAMMIETFGYIGSTLVVVSMLMSSVVKLRIINTIGSTISGIYALIIGSFPLALMNGCLIAINLYNLFKLLKSKQQYDLIDVKSNDAYLDYFITRYKQDIQIYFPDFKMDTAVVDQAYIICCNGNSAGILLGKQDSNDTIDILLDYSTPTYRDCSIGAYLYAKLPEKGIKKLIFKQNLSEVHKTYLNKMGFVKEGNLYIKMLNKKI